MERKERAGRRNSVDSLAVLGQAQHSSPVTRDWGRHVSSQIAPQAHWQELSAEKGEGLFLAYSHARVNHRQLQRGGAIKRPWWCGTEVCGLRYLGVISHCYSNQPFFKWRKDRNHGPMHNVEGNVELKRGSVSVYVYQGGRIIWVGIQRWWGFKLGGSSKHPGVLSTWCQITSEGTGPRFQLEWMWVSDDHEIIQIL